MKLLQISFVSENSNVVSWYWPLVKYELIKLNKIKINNLHRPINIEAMQYLNIRENILPCSMKITWQIIVNAWEELVSVKQKSLQKNRIGRNTSELINGQWHSVINQKYKEWKLQKHMLHKTKCLPSINNLNTYKVLRQLVIQLSSTAPAW